MVKIVIRPLKGDTFDVEVDEEAKVEDLKKAIAAAKSEYSSDQLKLIYSGKILVDTSLVKDAGIKPGDFVVAMATKAKSTPSAAPSAEPAAAPAAAAPASQAPAAPMPMDQAASGHVSGSAADETIANLCAMGFESSEVERCLRAAFGNPDRAVEYLTTGIPAGLLEEQAAAPQATAPAAGGGAPIASGGAPTPAQVGGPAGAIPFPAMGGGSGGGTPFPAMGAPGGGAGGGAGADAIAELRSNPRFAELAAMIAQNPAMLGQILPVLQAQNPELYQLITQNPDAFMRAIQDGAGAQEPLDPVATMLAAVQGGGGGAGPPPGSQVVQLSEAESAAVQRLQDLGFSREEAAQAYFACDKNEELAANFLFESGLDSMAD